MDDTISRAAAIDAFLAELTKRERKNFLHTWSTVEVKYFVADMLEKLPSAQPTCTNTVQVDDCISREAAIEAMRKAKDKSELHRMLVQLPSAQPGWIPTSERLPKPNEYENDVRKYYLVQNEHGDMMVCSWHGSFWMQMYRNIHVKDEVVAWMPLPTPYRERGQE